MKKLVLISILVPIIILSGCTKAGINSSNSSTIMFHIENSNGAVTFNDSEVAKESLELLSDKRYMTSAGCGFGNNVTVSIDDKIIKKFRIADDGCPTGMLENRKQFIIPYKLYNKLETIMQRNNNSLAVNGIGKPHLFDESKFEMPKMLFDIYLVKDLNIKDACSIELEKLPLEEKPLLVNYEMVEYDWTKHEFTLYDNFLERELEGKIPLAGKPFVICINGKKIYMGQFWTPISSMMHADVPLISSEWFSSSDNKTYKIEWLSQNKKDPRGDKRIYEALKRAGVLKEPELDIEKHIFNNYKGSNTSKQGRQEIFYVLPQIDWSRYEKISEKKSVELLTWIEGLNSLDVQELINILKAAKNLDGAITEKYSAVAGKLYEKDKVTFIRCLTSLQYGDSKTLEIINYFTYYFSYYDKAKYDKIVSETKNLLNSQRFTEQEKIIIEMIVNNMDK